MNLREKLSHFFVTGKSLGTAQTFSDLSPQADDTQETMLAKLLGVRRRITGTALASAARTSTTQSSDIQVGSAGAVILFWNVTAIAGTGAKLHVMLKDPVSGLYQSFGTTLGNTTTTGLRMLTVGTGAGGGLNATGTSQCVAIAASLSEVIRVEVTHTDGNSITYSVGYVLTA